MSSGPLDELAEHPEQIRAVPVRRPGRWIAAAIVLVITVALIRSVATNPRFQWEVVGEYLFDQRILEGLRIRIDPDGDVFNHFVCSFAVRPRLQGRVRG